MSSALAIVILSALFAASLAPLFLLARKSGAILPVAGGYAVLLALTTGYHAGLLERAALPENLDEAASPLVSSAQCLEMLSLLDGSGAIIERNRPPRLVVDSAIWSQFPPEAQQVVVDCIERSWPRGSGPAQLEVRAQ
jgi:hypothetical protein